MSNAIQFLEAMGSNAAWGSLLSTSEYVTMVRLLDIDGAQRQALLDRDEIALNTLNAGRSQIYCLIATPGL